MARKTHIQIGDDEKVVRESLCEWFIEDGYEVDTATDGAEALRAIDESTWDILLVDIKMPGMDGLEVQRRVKRADPAAIVIIITAYATVDTAVQALKEGAYDYIAKPIDPDDLARVISKAAERQQLVRENEELKQTLESVAGASMSEIVGDSPSMKKVREMISTVAETDATVLVTGESGTGKELVARAIHRASPRHHMPLVTVNCAGLPEGLVESELFGHEKGAFTGASYRRKGKFELADGGTVFFDEIGDISPKTQIDLLRVLEEKNITRIGGDRPIDVDFRVIAATHRDLQKAVEDEVFRLDLYYRLNVVTLELPPLRERPEDIPLLSHYFLERMAQAMGRLACRFSPEAMAQLQEYEWPGNVRELENAIERAVVLERGEVIQAESLPLSAPGAVEAEDPVPLSEVEKRHIQAVLDQMAGNISKAARFLEIDRVTLYNKIRKYGLRRPRD